MDRGSATNILSLLPRVRSLVIGAFLLSLIGTGAELVIVGHTDGALQWIPLLLILGCLMVFVWDRLSGSPASVRILRAMMAIFLLSAVLGLAVHWQGKIEFKREMDPSLGGARLVWEAMKSQSPPALAPGVFVLMALLGLIYTTLRSTK